MTLKLGRKPAVHTLRNMRSANVMRVALDTLGEAPNVSNDYIGKVTVPWGMMLNDTLGDCVCADTGHVLMLRTANVGPIVVPTDDDVMKLYEAVGGYVPGNASTDQGCNETTMCNYLETTGFLGHKADAIGTVDPKNMNHLRWCIQLFGSCRLGLNLPTWAMDAFNNGQPWGAPPPGANTTIEGGHDVPLVHYVYGQGFTAITWGQPQTITREFLELYCEEAHSELDFDWCQKNNTAPSGFDLSQLASEITAIGAIE